jgi:hypothetical protein
MEHKNYIILYRATKAPHFIPRFVLKWLVIKKISYQAVIYGVRETLYREKKAIWPPLPFWVGSYSFGSIKQVQEEVDMVLSFRFREERFWRHNSIKLSRNVAVSTNTCGSTPRPHGRRKKFTTVPRNTMKLFLRGRENHWEELLMKRKPTKKTEK